MRCDQLEIRLNELLDSRGSVHLDAAVTTHAAACPRCGEVLKTYRSLADLFDGSTPLDVPETSCERAGSRVVSTLQRRRQQRKWLYLSVSAAAAVLWAAFMTWRHSPGDLSPPAGEPRYAAAHSTAIDTYAAFQVTGRNIVAISDGLRWFAASPEADRIAVRFRPVTQPVWVALQALRDVWPDNSRTFVPQATDKGLSVLPQSVLLA